MKNYLTKGTSHQWITVAIISVLGVVYVQPVMAQPVNISGIINNYAKVIAIDTSCSGGITVISSAGFNPDDTVLVIQMKGALIDTANNAGFGAIISYNNSGNYEFNEIESVTGNVIALKYKLLRGYDTAFSVQLIRVPSYANATVTGALTAQVWNGQTGGVLILNVTDTLTFNPGTGINLNGAGFKGGDSSVNTSSNASDTAFVYPHGTFAGDKGEGIAILPAGYEAGRGAPANAGGGGNSNGGGGGGGANYGNGGGGGGQNYLGYVNNGGVGGKGLVYSAVSGKVFMGSGGGGGFQNNNCGTSGGPGGGIAIVSVGTIVGNAVTISAAGNNGGFSSCNDGTGGGGSGGSVLLNVQNFSGSLSVNTQGGHGGDNPNTGDGPGGGGGDGILWISGNAALPGNVVYTGGGGRHGNNNDTINFGLSSGQPGGFLNALQLPQSNILLTANSPAALISITASDSVICPGMTVTFTAFPVNGGTNPAYQWKKNGAVVGINDSVYIDSTLVNKDVVSCVMTSSAYCVSVDTALSNIITIAVNTIQAGTITALQDTICQGSLASLLLVNSEGAVQWQSSESTSDFTDINNASDTIYSDPLTKTTYFRVRVSNGGCSDTSAIFSLLVNPLPIPPVLTAIDSVICPSDSTLIQTSGAYSAYQWSNGDTGNNTFAANGGGYWVTVTDANGCTAVSSHINIDVYPIPSVSIVVQGDTLASFNAISYQWFLNDSLIPGADRNVYIAGQSGTYSVQVTDSNGCKTVSTGTGVTVTGIDRISANKELNIYPNPTSGLLFISVNGYTSGGLIRIVNSLGQEVKWQAIQPGTGERIIDVSELPAGIYELIYFEQANSTNSENKLLTGKFLTLGKR